MRFSLIALVELFLIISSSGQNLRGEKNTKILSSKQVKDEVESLLSSKEIEANADENDDGSEEKNRLDKIRDKIKYLEDLLSTETKDKIEEEFSEERDFSGNKLEDTIVEDQDETDYEEGNSKFEASSFSDEKSLFDKFSEEDKLNAKHDRIQMLKDKIENKIQTVHEEEKNFVESEKEEIDKSEEKLIDIIDKMKKSKNGIENDEEEKEEENDESPAIEAVDERIEEAWSNEIHSKAKLYLDFP